MWSKQVYIILPGGKEMYLKYLKLTLVDKPCLNINIFILHLSACITLVIISDSLGPAGSAVGKKGNLTPSASREGWEKGETKSSSEAILGGVWGRERLPIGWLCSSMSFWLVHPVFCLFSPTTEPVPRQPRLISDCNFLHLV